MRHQNKQTFLRTLARRSQLKRPGGARLGTQVATRTRAPSDQPVLSTGEALRLPTPSTNRVRSILNSSGVPTVVAQTFGVAFSLRLHLTSVVLIRGRKFHPLRLCRHHGVTHPNHCLTRALRQKMIEWLQMRAKSLMTPPQFPSQRSFSSTHLSQ